MLLPAIRGYWPPYTIGNVLFGYFNLVSNILLEREDCSISGNMLLT